MQNMFFFFLILLASIAGILSLALLFLRVLLLTATVELCSMAPTLKQGERVLALRLPLKRWLRKGQIVLIWPAPGMSIPAPAGYQGAPYIKRIVAMGGDTFALAPGEKSSPFVSPDHPRIWHIPPGHVFVRGDNPEPGMDSTVWGPVAMRYILAIVLMKLPLHPL